MFDWRGWIGCVWTLVAGLAFRKSPLNHGLILSRDKTHLKNQNEHQPGSRFLLRGQRLFQVGFSKLQNAHCDFAVFIFNWVTGRLNSQTKGITRSRNSSVGGGGVKGRATTPALDIPPPSPTTIDDESGKEGTSGERRGSGLSRRQRKNCRKREKAEKLPTASLKKGSKPPCRTYEKIGMSDQQIYYWIYSYCLDLIRLRRLGFPLESELHPGASVVYVDPDLAPLNDADGCYEDDVPNSEASSSLDVNAQEFVPAKLLPTVITTADDTDTSSPSPGSDDNAPIAASLNPSGGSTTSLNVSAKEFVPASSSPCLTVKVIDKDSASSNDEVEPTPADPRQCARCNKTFFVDGNGAYLSREKCLYHWGKIRYGKVTEMSVDRYTCCNSRVSDVNVGCCTAKVHVWRGKLFQMPGMHGPYKNFVRTKSRKCNPPNGYHGVYAIDGEMCYTTQGMELIRLSVVGIDGRPVYDTLVQPENPIVDYNTRFSGLTDRDMKNNPVKSLRHVQNDLMGFISSSTILIGHGLENDFRALRLVHTLVVDTSVLYPHYFGLPYRRSLKSLARSYLKQDIQTAAHGHDSFEDARASLELVLCKVKTEVASTVKNSNSNARGVYHAPFQGRSKHPSPVIPTSSIYSSPPRCELAANSKSRLKYEESFVEENSWFDLE